MDFYRSYGKKGMKILEPLCGTGRFLVPFLEAGLDICGMDLSAEMLAKLKEKAPDAKVVQADILEYTTEERFDYIFIPSGSVSLFTDMDVCKRVIEKLKGLLAVGGTFIFAVDTVANRCRDDDEYKLTASVKTKEGLKLSLRTKNYYDEKSQTQYSPGIYELNRGKQLLQREEMDFQTHLYRFGEMEKLLEEIGFQSVKTYATFCRKPAKDDRAEMFLFECRAD